MNHFNSYYRNYIELSVDAFLIKKNNRKWNEYNEFDHETNEVMQYS